MHDPLSIKLKKQTQVLLHQLSPSSPFALALGNAKTRPELLNLLSTLLYQPSLTLLVATAFRPILLDLCARWIHEARDGEEKLEAFALLLEVYPDLFPVLLSFLRTLEGGPGPLAFITSEEDASSIDVRRLQRVLLAYYRILHANRDLPTLLSWSLRPLSTLMWTSHLDAGVRYLAIRCYALQSGMGEAERVKAEKESIGEVSSVDCPLYFGEAVDGTPTMIDGWILPIVEAERVANTRQTLTEPQNYYASSDDSSIEPIHPAELSPHIANIHGVLMFRQSTVQHQNSSLIKTPSSVEALQTLATHLSLGLPTLLTSPPSSGKSLLLTHLASVLHPDEENQIITIHLADTSLDPRSLLGSYVSSTTQSGTFEWKEGVLVRAMREGRWVVFEDVDRGSNEVLGLIKPLVESLAVDGWIGGRAALEVPSRGKVVAHESFAVFATRSLLPSRNGKFASPTFFGAHKFHEMVVSSPSHQDLRIIFDAKFPRLAGAASEGLIRLWEAVCALGTASSVRDVGLRELEKICRRVDNLLPRNTQSMDVDVSDTTDQVLSTIFPNVSIREDILFEIRDVLFAGGVTTASARSHLDAVAATVADHLGLAPERRDWVFNSKIPEYQQDKDVNGGITSLRFGRTRLFASPATAAFDLPPARTFAMHKPATLLMSRIATAVSLNEPLLLTGETGTGKTSVVTHLASMLRKPLISLNLSNQTESSDIVGGFKPIDARVPASELQERFLNLFGSTFSRKKNAKFDESVRKAVMDSKWKRAVALWLEAVRMAKERIQSKVTEDQEQPKTSDVEGPRKRRKTEQNTSLANWEDFERDVRTFEVQHIQGNGKFAFGFVEGPLVKALRFGHWILLDEINLASAETLECVSTLLHSPTASITLTEQGSLEPVARHPDFRLFACMNPATDVGKKDLPPNIRSRFTEIDVPPPDADKDTLLSIVAHYIGPYAVGDKGAIMDVAEFYAAVRRPAEKREIADGSNHRPHYSMRTLARALTFAADIAATHSLRRALWEGCLMAFTMVLDEPSTAVVKSLAQKHILAGVRNPRSLLAKEPSPPQGRSVEDFVKFGPFYLERGPLPEDPMDEYIMTPSVEIKLIDLARIITTRRFPVLIEGPTSSGKTSSIEYLAKRTGHRFVRINNHEHTDIQEYLGTYVSDPATGKLVFKDGLLVRALRNGDWIVLDELNLAPTDVLEALNRLLDDNRELVIPETQEVVKPHPHFLLFATQNPSGLYGGRKVLSRAFRNRFLEVHFEDVPQAELETILCQRCKIAPSYAARIVTVFQELQRRRQSSRIFESKHGFATLRDLFRWAGRDAIDYQELAENGFMLLAERARKPDDKAVAKEVIESVMKVKIDEARLYELHNVSRDSLAFLGCPVPESSNLVWTSAMQRLFILVARALKFHEPVLLVGETGSGKTSVCQLYAQVLGRKLHALNCHQNTETADLIGGLRPLRNRAAMESDIASDAQSVLEEFGIQEHVTDTQALASIVDSLMKSSGRDGALYSKLQVIRSRLRGFSTMFQWYDGPLVNAMRNGEIFLLDEISLADDSVLERLNSVLEPSRTLVLAERGDDGLALPMMKAHENFELVATMNPGGDYGKKELSPALRNRFTEVWVPPVDNRQDLEQIVCSLWKHEALQSCTSPLLDFSEWLCQRISDRSVAGLRDVLAWVNFSNAVYIGDGGSLTIAETFHHAAHMTFLDGLGSLPQLSAYSVPAIEKLRRDAQDQLDLLFPITDRSSAVGPPDPSHVQLGPFAIRKGSKDTRPNAFSFQAPTTRDNVSRVVRACQLPKPVLLEGSPGVGKTSLVSALANICGYDLCRINLSDQTDLIDLFGSDLPVEGGGPGQFAWRDAEFLRAMQEGHWVLLDEMNLAPQAILEGLNAVLDHRGSVYIPELGRSFTRHPSFRIFAAQNPLHQGGGRKGLPKSFLNRFTKVYVQELSSEDVMIVCRSLFPSISEEVLHCMITFTSRLQEEVMVRRSFGREGSPWEFNLRDVIRWSSLVQDSRCHPGHFLHVVFLQRFRNAPDRHATRHLFQSMFPSFATDMDAGPRFTITPSFVQLGRSHNIRQQQASGPRPGLIMHSQLGALESLGICIAQNWLSILTGPYNSGKTTVVRTLASLTGHPLHEIYVNTATDASDILGSFEEVDFRFHVSRLARAVSRRLSDGMGSTEGSKTSVYYGLHLLLSNASADVPSTLSAISQVLNHMSPHDAVDLRATLQVLEQSAETPPTGRFEWMDGPLVEAIRHGYWVLLDGANLCNPSVLDRLNSLCENDGQLTLNERGAVDGEVQILKPHPNFRLFMTVDPRFGELSRAMRNRGVEVALLPLSQEDHATLMSHTRLLSVGDLPALSPVVSAHVRRGVAQLVVPAPGEVHRPHSYLWDEDVACAASYDLISDLPRYAQSQRLQSLLLFLAHAVAPVHTDYLRRLVMHLSSTRTLDTAVQEFFSQFPDTPSFNFSLSSRPEISRNTDIPLEVVLAQPLDFKMHRLSSSVAIEDLLSDTNIVVLRLTAVFSLCRKQPPHEQDQLHSAPSKLQTHVHRLIVSAVTALTRSVYMACQELCSIEVTIEHKTAVLASVLMQLLGFSRYVDRIAADDLLDFSALQAATSWLADVFRRHPDSLERVQSELHALNNALSLNSGHGITLMWAALSEPIASHTEDIGLKLEGSTHIMSPDLRKSVLELLALRLLPRSDQQYDSAVKELTARVQNRIGAAAVPREQIDPHAHISELAVLSAISTTAASLPKNTIEQIHRRLKDAIEDTSVSLRRAAPYMCLQWLSDAGRNESCIMTILYTEWLESLWTASLTEEIQGPTLLHIPTQLSGVITLCDWSNQMLSSVSFYEATLHRRSSLVLSQVGQPDRTKQLTLYLLRSVYLIASPCLDQTHGCGLLDLPSDFAQSWPTWIDQFSSAVMTKQHDYLVDAFQRTLQPELLSLRGHQLENSSIWRQLGKCFIKLCYFLTTLYVPDRPVDPAAVEKCTRDYQSDQISLLNEEIDLHTRLETRTSGQKSNGTISFLQSQRPATPAPNSVGPAVSRDLPRLHSYWSEVDQLLKLVLATNKIDAFVTHSGPFDSSMIQRENVVQESISAFCQRLDTVYPDFADLSRPLQLGLQFMKLGLRILIGTALPPSDSQVEDGVVAAVTAFPSVVVAERLQTALVSSDPQSRAFEFLMARIASVAFEAVIGVDVRSRMETLSSFYDQVLGLWLVDRAREAEYEREGQSLYKSKVSSSDGLNDAELEEEEFRALFPEYSDVLDDTSPANGRKTAPHLIDLTAAVSLVAIHNSLFVPSDSPGERSPWLSSLQRAILRSTMKDRLLYLSDRLDSETLPLQVALLHERSASFTLSGHVSNIPRDFYSDSNIQEARKFVSSVTAFVARLEELMLEWPDQMVLHHLRARCDAALRLSIHSPVAKLLSALEQLLLQSEDWEGFANRSNSIKMHQQAFTSLIVEWRRSELSAWADLLEIQTRRFEEGLSEWWFRLYEVIIHGTLKATRESGDDDSAVTSYLEGLVPLLEDFLKSSPLGQFSPRLRLLQSFEGYASMLSQQVAISETVALDRVRRVLHSIRDYYAQFEGRTRTSLSEQRSALEKDIKGFIKIASWRDINVQALRQSAQKTHHQLYKSIRKYREILRQPVTNLLEGAAKEYPQSHSSLHAHTPGELAREMLFESPSSSSSQAQHLSNLTLTFRKFSSFIGDDLKPFLESHTPHQVEALAVDIISGMKSLSESAIASGTDGERRTKLLKNLLQRKRKAWSDMLKELKRSGLAANLKPEVLLRQRRTLWLREQPSTRDIVHTKVDLYWNRLMGALPLLRDSLVDHHADLSTREIQRGVMFVESCFSIAVAARARFAEAHIVLGALSDTTSRLKQLSNNSVIHCAGFSAKSFAVYVSHSICKLASALSEMSEHLHMLVSLPGEIDVPDALLLDVLAEIAAVQQRRDPVSEVYKNVHMSFPFLLDHEYILLAESVSFMKAVEVKILEWNAQFPHLRQFILPVHRWLSARSPPVITDELEPAENDDSSVIDALLIAVQSLLDLRPSSTPPSSSDEEASENYIRDGWNLAAKALASLNMATIHQRSLSFLRNMTSRSADDITDRVHRMLPFLQNFVVLARTHVTSLGQWTESLLKLNYVLCNVVQGLAKDGFCQPKETEEGSEGMEGGEAMEGTGLGEGNGAENVSKEIQDESQVEGLQGESGADDDVERAEEDNAIEMADDFGGKMQDVPEGEEEEGEEEDDGSDEEPDDQLGKVDANDEGAVDEKLWGDEHGPEGRDEQSKQSDKDDSTQSDAPQDVVAKEGDQDPNGPQESKEPQLETPDAPPEDMTEEDALQEDQDDHEAAGQDGAPLDDYIQNAETLDLPDDIDMDGGKEDAQDDDVGMDEDDAMSEAEVDDNETKRDLVETAEEDADDEDGPGQDQVAGDLPENDAEQKLDKEVAQLDTSGGDGIGDGTATDTQPADSDAPPLDNLDATQAQADGSAQKASDQSKASQRENEDSGPEVMQSHMDSDPVPTSGSEATAGQAQSESAQSSSQSQSHPQQLISNPLRSLGDALKEITRRFDDILHSEPHPNVQKSTDAAGDTQMEYLRDEDEDEMQALGPAGLEQTARLDELKFATQEEPSTSEGAAPMDFEEDMAETEPTAVELGALSAEPSSSSTREGVESALTQQEIRNMQLSGATAEDAIEGVPSAEISSRPEHDDTNVNVERQLREWHSQNQPSSEAEHMWRLYESLTHDLSYALCEQLRLILEPTQATRLKGDYRTGKRLNMKKIIPYIASEYTKDKIWLRRTRPSQREYQVLVALDDSRSMAESHSVHLAFQTLALVSKALSRLEVGDVAIAKFGEAVDVLHGFDKGPFTDQAGTAVLDAFKFDQKATQVLSLVDTSLLLLEQAREQRSSKSSSAADLWQMEIIISDGICQDHERIATVLRKAEEQRVMVVFIILDSLHSKDPAGADASGSTPASNPATENSILSMNQVAYKEVNGKMDLTVTRYLDTFPFEYYVVVRDVEALPDVLAGTLKQFFERISED
ncbi:hypothetical protein EIP91_001775 [Steccherinum ochraceum]|uniref:Midasin n=1 Tax=Steccherinum ochraceum TaxID=92696 RepID=A0A4R0RSB8_9APHY|nr:hypothetical protein EIP91_001775 [Steccherinum ochraceum]